MLIYIYGIYNIYIVASISIHINFLRDIYTYTHIVYLYYLHNYILNMFIYLHIYYLLFYIIILYYIIYI